MSDGKPNGVASRRQRRWSFGHCVFDEANWSLIVRGRRVPIEAKPLELLRELLQQGGDVVSKEQLLDSVWCDVTVVEASLPTAVRKLRLALGNGRIIETVSGIGYRIAVPVRVDEPVEAGPSPAASSPPEAAVAAPPTPAAQPQRPAIVPRLLSVGGGLAIALAAVAVYQAPSQDVVAPKSAAAYSQADVETAIRELDIDKVKRMIAAGWDPATRWDKEGNDALGLVINHCEWDIGRDPRQMLMMARTLIEAGAPIDRRNVWGDTAYSIAKAPRYCGPDHPVTQMLEAMCYGGSMGPRDRCLATYELTAEQRRAQGLPPKGKKAG